MSDGYRPEYPSEITTEWLNRELQRISADLSFLRAGHYEVIYAEPTRPRQGDVRYADGTEWDPGSGEGLYLYKSDGAWHFLG